jgi:hypothetical protein
VKGSVDFMPVKHALPYLPLALLLLLLAPPAHAQTPADELRKLDFLVGEWKGKGWSLDGRGGRGAEMSQSVKVERERDAPALRVRDTRTIKLPSFVAGGSPTYSSAPNHASVYFDEAAKVLRWRHDKDRKNPSELKLVGPRSVQWEQRSEMGAVRITVSVTDAGEWHEVTEFWSNSQGWQKAFEAVLKPSK